MSRNGPAKPDAKATCRAPATEVALTRKRISVSLDPELLLEALVLERLAALPKRRHADWIRSLVTQGFLAESRRARELGQRDASKPHSQRSVPPPQGRGFEYSAWYVPAPRPTRATVASLTEPTRTPTPAPPRSAATPDTDKPFAHLRKVVG